MISIRMSCAVRTAPALLAASIAEACWANDVTITDGDTITVDGTKYRLDRSMRPRLIRCAWTTRAQHGRAASVRGTGWISKGLHLLDEDQCSLLSVLLRRSIRLARARKCAASFMQASITSSSELWRAAKRQSSASSR
jgi:hypothetical protein